jgi:tripartite ATP-independent transporter DctP family solute receptor
LWQQAFIKNLGDITGGKITCDYFPNSQLGDDAALLTQMQQGDIDVFAGQPGMTASFVPGVFIYDLPLVFAKYSGAQIDKALNHSAFTDAINEEYAKAKMYCISVVQNGTYRVMTSNKDIKTLADFKGIKIRTMNNPLEMQFWQCLGATPTPLAFSELYMSLQQGVVDAQENANDTNANMNFQEVQKYLVNVKQLLYMNQLIMNVNRWETLPKEYQDAIRQAADQATQALQPQLQKINDDARDKLVAGGMKVIDFSNAQYDEIIKVSEPVYKAIRAKIGDKLVDTLIASLEGK